jgi:phosphopantothenoylcysteine decarboxylase/phosphopantothenate--cysteine ligase
VAGKRPKAGDDWQLTLHPTEDVLRTLGDSRNGTVLVGFGAEEGEEGLERKRRMLADKHLDLVVFNDVSRGDIGFDSPDNEVVLIGRDGERRVGKAPKREIAAAILDEVEALLRG